jgi:hypothetical protein
MWLWWCMQGEGCDWQLRCGEAWAMARHGADEAMQPSGKVAQDGCVAASGRCLQNFHPPCANEAELLSLMSLSD